MEHSQQYDQNISIFKQNPSKYPTWWIDQTKNDNSSLFKCKKHLRASGCQQHLESPWDFPTHLNSSFLGPHDAMPPELPRNPNRDLLMSI